MWTKRHEVIEVYKSANESQLTPALQQVLDTVPDNYIVIAVLPETDYSWALVVCGRSCECEGKPCTS